MQKEMDLGDNYVFCKEVRITSAMLFDKQDMIQVTDPKKGLILELFQVQSSAAVPWSKLSLWIYTLFGEEPQTQQQALRRAITRLKTRRQYLQKNPAKKEDLKQFLNEPFVLPSHTLSQNPGATGVKVQPVVQSRIEREAIQLVNKSLAKEVVHLQDACENQKAELRKQDEKIKMLAQYKPHNVRRRIQRKDAKISKQQECINQQSQELKQRDQKEAKRAREQIRYYKQKCAQLQPEDESECEDCKGLEEQLLKLKSINIELMEANAILHDEVAASKSRKVETYVDGKYTESMRLCIMDILSHNVGIKQVEPVIQAVLRLVGMECDSIPKHTAISEMLLESRALSQIQLAQTLANTEGNTLHSDGTTKFGQKYCGYQISTAERSLTLGLQVHVYTLCTGVIVTTHNVATLITMSYICSSGSCIWCCPDNFGNLTGGARRAVSN